MNKPISMSPSKTKQYLSAILDAGMDVAAVEITPDGNLRVLSAEASKSLHNSKGSSDAEEYQKFLQGSANAH